MKIHHDDIEFQISQLIDGDLPERQAEALREQIARDPAVAELYRQYQQLQQGLEAELNQTPSIDWNLQAETISAELERDALLAPARSPWPGRILRWGGLGAAAAAAVVLAATLLPWGPGGPQPEPGELAVEWIAPASEPGEIDADLSGTQIKWSQPTLSVSYSEPTTAQMAQPRARISPPAEVPGRGTIVIATGRAGAVDPTLVLGL